MVVVFFMWLLIGAAIGAGFTFVLLNRSTKVFGVLRIDSSDPDEDPYIFLELESSPETLSKEDYVTLRVSTKSYLSQE